MQLRKWFDEIHFGDLPVSIPGDVLIIKTIGLETQDIRDMIQE